MLLKWLCVAAATFALGTAHAQPAPKKAPAATAAPAKATAPAPHWTVDATHSSIGFESSVSGQTFRGAFPRWSAFIAFDPANLGASRVRVVIDVGAAASGDASRDATLKQENWFDATRFPQAVFQASSFRALGANRYEASGILDIKGKKTPIVLPFTLAITGANADMQASLSLNRRTLGFGLDMPDATVPAAVAVTLRVKATRAP